jgi:metal-sulfur cluster biosynthetic enzyme
VNENEKVNEMSEDTTRTQNGAEAQSNSAGPETDLALMDLENKAREALREVYDPELGMSVMELGLIRKFDWAPDSVDVTMILTTPFCPYGPALIEQVRQKVQEATERVARVTMGLEMWDPTMMEDQAAANWGLYY